jgi:hypothetical protein
LRHWIDVSLHHISSQCLQLRTASVTAVSLLVRHLKRIIFTRIPHVYSLPMLQSSPKAHPTPVLTYLYTVSFRWIFSSNFQAWRNHGTIRRLRTSYPRKGYTTRELPRSLFNTAISNYDHFSECTIQRQLQYLVAQPEPDRNEALDGEVRHGEECCWHQCDGWVWCCGHTCHLNSLSYDTSGHRLAVGREEAYFYARVDGEREGQDVEEAQCAVSMPDPIDDTDNIIGSGADCGFIVQIEKQGSHVSQRGGNCYVMGVRRDEWACDFCGQECFCWTMDVGLYS